MPENRSRRLSEMIEQLRVAPGSKVDLPRDFDPAFRSGWMSREEGEEHLALSVALLAEYQDRLAAQDVHGLLIVLQGIDAAGKDGTIRHVMSGVNPQGVVVHSFKVPSAEELNHDFLWRYVRDLPGRGQIGIFNRSHYEEVLVVRVHPELLARQQLPATARGADVWHRRYAQINDWERHLVENGIKTVKLFLNLSREEQRIRFLKRIDLAEKNWKLSAADIAERAHWDDYQHAYSQMLTHTSTAHAPWFVIPADHKWFARIAVGAVIADALVKLDPRYPTISDEARIALLQARAELEAQAPPGAPPDPFEAAGDHGRSSA
ncbi:MAG: polyphosphate kinase 2 family protein [Solirubrobacteraceae bacterium]